MKRFSYGTITAYDMKDAEHPVAGITLQLWADEMLIGPFPGPTTVLRFTAPVRRRKPVVHRLKVTGTDGAPFTACCGYNYRSLLEAGDMITSKKKHVTCKGREHVNEASQA